jgi:GWxTD domain-containing protein
MGRRTVISLAAGVLLFICGCSQGDRFVRSTDSMVRLSAGIPYFELQPAVVWQDSVQGIEVWIGCANHSRVFFQDSTRFWSVLEISVRLVLRGDGKDIADRSWLDTTVAATYVQTRDMELRRLSLFLPAPNGAFSMIVTAMDRFSGKRLTQRRDIDVFTDRFSIASGIIERKGESGAYTPMFVNHLAGLIDSALVTVVVNTPRPGRYCEAGLRLVQYPADDAPAVPPHFFTAPMNSMGNRGVDYTIGDTVRSTDLEWITEDRQAEIGFPLGVLPAGYYRAIVTLRIRRDPHSPRARILTLTRDVVVLSQSFPHVKTAQDYIDPVVYIASPSEMTGLHSASSEEERMNRLRAFWLAPSRTEGEAAQSMNTYYGRVEEANWFFTIHKEGWKTDQGMIYIVHGPPASIVHDRPDTEVWLYPDRGIQYTFTRVRQERDDDTLPENYILVRPGSIGAPHEWLDAIREFRGGVVPFGID